MEQLDNIKNNKIKSAFLFLDNISYQNAKIIYDKLKSGAFAILFNTEKSYHKKVSNLEKAGFEIKDMISVYLGRNNKIEHKPLTLIQKPREDTYCYNIKKYGCGGINIKKTTATNGRFPANLILIHNSNCKSKELRQLVQAIKRITVK